MLNVFGSSWPLQNSIEFACHEDHSAYIGPGEVTARGGEGGGLQPDLAARHQQLSGGQELAGDAVAPSDQVCLRPVVVVVVTTAEVISAGDQPRQVVQMAGLVVDGDLRHGVVAPRQDDSVAEVDGAGPTEQREEVKDVRGVRLLCVVLQHEGLLTGSILPDQLCCLEVIEDGTAQEPQS